MPDAFAVKTRLSGLPIDPVSKGLAQLDQRVQLHTPHLERVSRSFAYGISRLELSLKASVGLGYLLCRVLDTIEDASWDSSEAQVRAFTEFDLFITSEHPDRSAIESWARRFPASISEGERLLLDDAPMIFAEFSVLDARERGAMLDPILSMSRGMRAFTERTRQTGRLRLVDVIDVNVYCFFVAGVVGELLTSLVLNQAEMRPIGRESIWESGTHFGLFLQKVNILKDQWVDESEGRFLVPDRDQLLASLQTHAAGAFRYLEAIPVSRKDYRLFCAWALFLGLATIPLLRRANRDQGAVKLSRINAMALGARIEFSILDVEKQRAFFAELAALAWPQDRVSSQSFAREAESIAPVADLEIFLRAHYRGRMEVTTLAHLLAGIP